MRCGREPIDRPQERRQRLAGPGRGVDERMTARSDGFPALFLGGGGGGEGGLEPGPRRCREEIDSAHRRSVPRPSDAFPAGRDRVAPQTLDLWSRVAGSHRINGFPGISRSSIELRANDKIVLHTGPVGKNLPIRLPNTEGGIQNLGREARTCRRAPGAARNPGTVGCQRHQVELRTLGSQGRSRARGPAGGWPSRRDRPR